MLERLKLPTSVGLTAATPNYHNAPRSEVSTNFRHAALFIFIHTIGCVTQVGPLWVGTAEAKRGDGFTVSPGSRETTSGAMASGGTAHAGSCDGEGRTGVRSAGVQGDSVEDLPEARNKGLEGDVWAWLEPVRMVEGREDVGFRV